MKLDNLIVSKEITEILHFTTNLGLTGTLYSHSLKSRQRLESDKQLEYIFSANAAFRKDEKWLDYVNLSISRINNYFFNVSAGRWHRERDIWWCVLAFSPEILLHEGVWFTTTNNIYTGVQRGQGTSGFELMFADRVTRWCGNVAYRQANTPDKFTTCEQAEVLYPGEVPTSYLKKIYVATEQDADDIYGKFYGIQHPEIEVVINRGLFEQQ